MKSLKIDKVFLALTILLMIAGTLIFSSASMGLLTREGVSLTSVYFSQFFFGLFLGTIAMIVTAKIPYRFWRKYSFFIFIGSLLLTALVFVPHIGFNHGGAARWIIIGSFSFQPSEFLKIGFLLYLAAWLSAQKDKVSDLRHGMGPFLAISGVVAVIMLAQPDTTTFMVIFGAGLVMLICAGDKLRHVVGLILIAVLAIGLLAVFRPYVMQRITTFINPANDPQGAGYQIQQSLIAIGSGKVTGRGFGQSIQKFNFLPEPMGDSIFAVASEEFGFIGASALIVLLTLFTIRGLKIAAHSADSFGGLLTVGIITLIVTQSFINIASMLGVLPLSGLPLIFVSQGGTALFFALAEVGIILNISKSVKLNR
jgi:cell division protein FtsW